MKYYVVSDPHAYFTEMKEALDEAGYFQDKDPHKLIICGDIMDRGRETLEMQEFIYGLLKKDEVILIRGNHEDHIFVHGWIPCNLERIESVMRCTYLCFTQSKLYCD